MKRRKGEYVNLVLGGTKMRLLLNFLTVLTLATVALAEGLNVAESAKKPGDPLRYTISLESPIKGTVGVIYVNFKLQSHEREDQQGLQASFDLSKFTKSGPAEYKIDDVVPKVMSGTYRLESIQFRTNEGGTMNYAYPKDIKQENLVKIDNDDKDIFPKIKSVNPTH